MTFEEALQDVERHADSLADYALRANCGGAFCFSTKVWSAEAADSASRDWCLSAGAQRVCRALDRAASPMPVTSSLQFRREQVTRAIGSKVGAYLLEASCPSEPLSQDYVNADEGDIGQSTSSSASAPIIVKFATGT